jgi:hypothetical protein
MSELSEFGAASGIPPHEVLLWLAGRIDDDLLAWARELIAVGEDDQAVELITATLIADRVSLPPMLRDWVVERSCELSLEPAAEDVLPPAADDAPLHVFVGELAPDSGLSEADGHAQSERLRSALAGVAERHLRAGSWWLAWRLTPAGAAPGPLPHPVILVELGPDAGSSAEVVAYQVADAVQRAGLTASVEVFDAGATLPEYHQSALREARSEAPAGPYGGAALVHEPGADADLDPDTDVEVDVAEADIAEADVAAEPHVVPVATEQVVVPAAAEPARAQHRLREPSTPFPAAEYDADGYAELPVDSLSDSWSDEWVTGEWSETPVSAQLAGLTDTERGLLAQLQEELAEREARSRQTRGHGGSASQRPGVAEPPGLAG